MTIRTFAASFKPHGANPDGLAAATWTIEAGSRREATGRAMDMVGEAIGKTDFAYRELADGSRSILDTVCGNAKIASLKLIQTGHRA